RCKRIHDGPTRPPTMPRDGAQQSTHDDLKAPNALLLMLEGRAPWEFAAMLASSPVLNRALDKLPPGDGHPVLVFPGLPPLISRPCRCATSCATAATCPTRGSRASTSA